MKYVVYKIVNTISGRFYVGSTSDFQRRKSDHLKMILSGTHNSYLLENELCLRSVEDFEFKIIKRFSNAIQAHKFEQKLICMYWGTRFSYNVDPEVIKNSINDVILAWNLDSSLIRKYLSCHAVFKDLRIPKILIKDLLSKRVVEVNGWILDLASESRSMDEVLGWYEKSNFPSRKTVDNSFSQKEVLRKSNSENFLRTKQYIYERILSADGCLKIQLNSTNDVKKPFKLKVLDNLEFYRLTRSEIEDALFGFGKSAKGFLRNFVSPALLEGLVVRERIKDKWTSLEYYRLTKKGYELSVSSDFKLNCGKDVVAFVQLLLPEFSEIELYKKFGDGVGKTVFFELLAPYIEAGFVEVLEPINKSRKNRYRINFEYL